MRLTTSIESVVLISFNLPHYKFKVDDEVINFFNVYIIYIAVYIYIYIFLLNAL